MYKYIKGLQNFPTTLAYIMAKNDLTNDFSRLRAATDWLLAAQAAAGGTGYAHSYHLIYGWQPPYPETTGYLIPSMLRANSILHDDRLTESVKYALNWLLNIQSEDGHFCDLQGNPQVFDTGQILIGLNYIAEHHPEIARVEGNLRRAAGWLSHIQEPDGSFVKHAYNNRPHTYYSRVGAALIKSGQLLDDESIQNAGIKNISWTMNQQMDNGFFNYLSFDNHAPFLHTIAYVIEGLLDAFSLTNNQQHYDSATRLSDRLLELTQDSSLLRSQYNAQFDIDNPHLCTTGLAQWAGICFRITHISGNTAYQEDGIRSLNAVAAHQIISNNRNIHGALPGSVPVYGNYLRLAFPNWGMKFFIDGLLAKGLDPSNYNT